jgi:hypothetical protein
MRMKSLPAPFILTNSSIIVREPSKGSSLGEDDSRGQTRPTPLTATVAVAALVRARLAYCAPPPVRVPHSCGPGATNRQPREPREREPDGCGSVAALSRLGPVSCRIWNMKLVHVSRGSTSDWEVGAPPTPACHAFSGSFPSGNDCARSHQRQHQQPRMGVCAAAVSRLGRVSCRIWNMKLVHVPRQRLQRCSTSGQATAPRGRVWTRFPGPHECGTLTGEGVCGCGVRVPPLGGADAESIRTTFASVLLRDVSDMRMSQADWEIGAPGRRSRHLRSERRSPLRLCASSDVSREGAKARKGGAWGSTLFTASS